MAEIIPIAIGTNGLQKRKVLIKINNSAIGEVDEWLKSAVC